MYSLLIVDDEPVIADGIYDLCQEIKEPAFMFFKAYSGREGLELIHKNKIDVVLTDICMPDIDGFEVQKAAKAQWPHCKIIFLTGHDEFEYAQKAIRYGGADFILKTEKDEVILHAVLKAAHEIALEAQNEELLEKAKESMHLALPVLREKLLLELLDGAYCEPEERSAQFLELEMPFSPDALVLLMIGQIDTWPQGITFKGKMRIIYGIQNITESYLSKNALIMPVIFEKEKLVWLIQPHGAGGRGGRQDPKLNWQRTILYVHGMMDSIQNACQQLFGVTVSFATGKEAASWELVAENFDSLKLALLKSSGMSREMLLIDDSTQNRKTDGEGRSQIPEETMVRAKLKKVGQLDTCLASGQREEFIRLLTEITDQAGYPGLPQVLQREVFYTLAALFLSYLNRSRAAGHMNFRIDLDHWLRMEKEASWSETAAYFKNLAEVIFRGREDAYQKNTHRIISHIKNFAGQNLDKDLSLNAFAQDLHLNPSYLSRLYKHVTGESFTEYVAELKIAKARELLKQKNLKINEVASALGFETASYFTRFFKKFTNLSPQEYRDSFQE